LASAYLENSFGIFTGSCLFTKLVASHAPNHTPNVMGKAKKNMTSKKINDVKQTIGFFSLTLAWAVMNLINSFHIAIEDGKADDSGVIIFWSGLFIFISWALFIIWPLNRLDHSRKLFRPLIFTLLSTLYASIAYAIIVGGLFRSVELLIMFLPEAIITGMLFGLFYSLFIRSDNVINYLYARPVSKSLFFLSPVIILVFFLWFLPLVSPTLVYRFVPDAVRDKIVQSTIPKYKVGDDIESLQRALPGYLDHIRDGKGNMFASMENFVFVLQVNCGKIIRLEYGQNQSDINDTIYGNLQDKPCP